MGECVSCECCECPPLSFLPLPFLVHEAHAQVFGADGCNLRGWLALTQHTHTHVRACDLSRPHTHVLLINPTHVRGFVSLHTHVSQGRLSGQHTHTCVALWGSTPTRGLLRLRPRVACEHCTVQHCEACTQVQKL